MFIEPTLPDAETAWLVAQFRDGPNAPDAARLRQASLQILAQAASQLAGTPDRTAAIALYRAWIESQGKAEPHLFAAWFNMGVELARIGRTVAAIGAHRNALLLRPDFAAAAINLATLLTQDGRPELAIPVLESALQTDEARSDLFNNRARLLEKHGRLREAEQEMERSLLVRPDQPDVMQHWLHVRQKQCRWPVFADAPAGVSHDALTLNSGPMAALALFDDIAQQRAISENWIRRKTEPAPERLCPTGGYRHDRIRIGYLSSDFCRHAMSMLIAELFERHDRSRFEVFGFCSSPEDGSDVRARVIAAFDHFTRIAELSDEQAARAIRDQEIDILVDLNGLTSGTRLPVLRWRPAPVQATYLGFIGPVPLPELDYMFCDSFVVPSDATSEYQPAPLHIAKLYQANDSRRALPAPRPRAEAGLPDDRFVFCCFSNHYKITREMFDAWTEILRRTGDSVLWLITDGPDACGNLTAAAEAAGIDPARLIFSGRVSPTDYLANLGAANLFLDTYPYNAGTIASDAMRMQLPLLTLCGRSFVSRMAARLLTAVGAQDGIATSHRDYVERAVAFATDAQQYRAYRALFTEHAWQSSLGDMAKFTREYEATLASVVVRPPQPRRAAQRQLAAAGAS